MNEDQYANPQRYYYNDFYPQKRYEAEKYNYAQKLYEYEKSDRDMAEQEQLTRELEASFYERLRQITNFETRKVIVFTYEQKMNMKNFTLDEIIRLTDALSLSIGNPDERVAFDNIVRNWRDDRIKEIK